MKEGQLITSTPLALTLDFFLGLGSVLWIKGSGGETIRLVNNFQINANLFYIVFAMDTPSYVFIRPMILVSLECIGFCQRNGINLVLMQSMVFKIQLFLIYTFQKVVALHVLHEGRKYSYRCTVMLARNCIHCVHSKKTTTLPDH